jgi:hypothetical protein
MSHDDFPTLETYVAEVEALPFVQSGNKKIETAYTAHEPSKKA